MADLDGPDGPKRVQRIIGEVFEFTLAHGQVQNMDVAGHSMQLVGDKLENVCRECQAQTLGGDTVEDLPTEGVGNEKRRMHLLRLVSCKLSHLFDKEHNPNPMDRAYALGIDLYFRRILSDDVYSRVNNEAKQILAAAGGDDVRVFNLINSNIFFGTFIQNILVRIVMSFVEYEKAKALFIKDVNDATPGDFPDLTHEQYRVLMSALLFDVFIKGKSELDGQLLDYRFGPGAADALNQVSDKFGRDNKVEQIPL